MAEDPAALVVACQRGSPDAWERLVRRFGRLVCSIAARQRFDQSTIDDVFQVVFSRLHQSIHTLDDASAVSSWLITTTHRECWRVAAEQKRQHRGIAGRDTSDQRVQTAALEQAELQLQMHESLTELGGRCEKLLRALFLDPGDPNYEEIAAQLSVSANSIGAIRSRCLKQLEAILEKRGFFRTYGKK